MSNYTGSIDLTKVPKRFFKKVMCKDGTEHVFLNVGLWERKTPPHSESAHTPIL